MGRLTDAHPPRSAQLDRALVVRRAVLLAVAATVPAWLVSNAVIDWFFRHGTDGFSGVGWFGVAMTFPVLWEPVITLILDAVTVVVLSARGRFRSDRWWAAGGLFVVNSVLAMIAVEAPEAGSMVFFHIMLTMLSGHWIITFAAGSLLWRRLTPTYVPTDWLRPPDPEDE